MEIPIGMKSLASGLKLKKKIPLFTPIQLLLCYVYTEWIFLINWQKQCNNNFFGRVDGLKVIERFFVPLFFPLNKAFFTCSITITPGHFTRIRWSCSLPLLTDSRAPGSCASHFYCGLEPFQSSLGLSGWVKMDGDQIQWQWVEESPGNRRQAR